MSKATIIRYETFNSSRPQGYTERKLIQLRNFLQNEEDRHKIEKLKKDGGIAGIAGLLAISSAMFTVSAAVAGGIGLASIIAAPSLGALGLLGGLAGGIIGAAGIGIKNKNVESQDESEINHH